MGRYAGFGMVFPLLICLVGCSSQPDRIEKESQAASDREEIGSVEVVPQGESAILIPVPFTIQAPFGEWSEELNEACEEAALIMVEFSLRGEPLTRSGALREIESLMSWEEEHGFAIDVTAMELGEIAKQYYGRESRILTGSLVTRDAILHELTRGTAIIVPAAGRSLGNPYYRTPGPVYHMLVIRGYRPPSLFSPEKFITNDPGTRHGEEYSYPVTTILSALHDWNGSGGSIEQGQMAMLIIDR